VPRPEVPLNLLDGLYARVNPDLNPDVDREAIKKHVIARRQNIHRQIARISGEHVENRPPNVPKPDLNPDVDREAIKNLLIARQIARHPGEHDENRPPNPPKP